LPGIVCLGIAPSMSWRKIWPWCAPAFVVIGLALRAYHYGRNPSVWHDEAALILNVLGKSFVQLWGSLYFAEAAPPLFLCLERAVRLLLGGSTFALRLVPFAASCAALVLTWVCARRLLRPYAVPLAAGLFACSSSLLWHACEAKPYAIDIAAASLLLFLATGTAAARPIERRLLVYSALAPILILLSYPGCFLAGGLALSLLPAVLTSKTRCAYTRYALLNALIGVAFLLLWLGPAHAQRCQTLDQCWLDGFAPWSSPWRLLPWTANGLGELAGYCIEANAQLLIIPAIVGFISLWRRGRREAVILMTSPLALTYLAACLHAYPFGGTRVTVFAAPALTLGVAEGSIVLLEWLGKAWVDGWAQRRPMACTAGLALAGLLLALVLPAGRAAYEVIVPWPRSDGAAAARFVFEHQRPGDAVAGNHWEHAYYFRSLGHSFSLWEGLPLPDSNRTWLVLATHNSAEFEPLEAAAMRGQWRALSHTDFQCCRVILLERSILAARLTPVAPACAQ
jgi:hypothetical protein